MQDFNLIRLLLGELEEVAIVKLFGKTKKCGLGRFTTLFRNLFNVCRFCFNVIIVDFEETVVRNYSLKKIS